MIDQDFIMDIEKKIKRVLSAMEVIKLHDMDELYDRKEIVEAIDKSIYKARPIDYAMAICRSNALQKVQETHIPYPHDRDHLLKLRLFRYSDHRGGNARDCGVGHRLYHRFLGCDECDGLDGRRGDHLAQHALHLA